MTVVICGVTVALANVGLLDSRKHTCNEFGFLEMFCSDYKVIKVQSVIESTMQPGGYIADPEGNLIEIGLFKEE